MSFWHCHMRFYTSVGQPFWKLLYIMIQLLMGTIHLLACARLSVRGDNTHVEKASEQKNGGGLGRKTGGSVSKYSGAPNDGFLPNALKRCFRLSGVLLKLCRLILGCAIK